jgi:hypothetical protein
MGFRFGRTQLFLLARSGRKSLVRGMVMSGYWALACDLRKAIEAGVRVTDVDFLESLDVPTLRSILGGTGMVPMIAERVANLNEAGKVLRQSYDGSFVDLLEEAGGSAERTISLVTQKFSSFDDVAIYADQKVYRLSPSLIWPSETVCVNGGGVSKYLLSRAVRDAGYKVVYTGEGSDENLRRLHSFSYRHVTAEHARPRHRGDPAAAATA